MTYEWLLVAMISTADTDIVIIERMKLLAECKQVSKLLKAKGRTIEGLADINCVPVQPLTKDK